MNRTFRHLLTVAALVGAVAAPATVAAEQPDLSGVYMSQGVNPDGTKYKTLVEVTRRGDSFLVSWLSPERTDGTVRITRVSVGVGIVDGDVLAVSYSASHAPAIAMYRIEDDGRRLIGQWAMLSDDGGVYVETLEKLQPGDAPAVSAPPLPDPAPASSEPVAGRLEL